MATLNLQSHGKVDVRLGESSRPMQGRVQRNVNQYVGVSDIHMPLSPLGIQKIEELRRGGDLQFNVWVRITFLAFPEAGGEPYTMTLWAERSKQVPRSQWVEEFLHRLGYGDIQIWEVRASMATKHDQLAGEYARLGKAVTQLDLGHWDHAHKECREAIDSILKRQDELGLAAAIDPKAVKRISDYLSLALHLETAIDSDWEPDREDAFFAVSTTKALLDRVSAALHNR
ncbi:MAG: hypothetical protein LC623_05595 [Halobacteriales archaeon]|nr:hypothetical protein [Halobacteriales archaeon]